MNVDWQVSDTVRLRGKVLTPGRELRIRGQRGRFRFVKAVHNTRTGAEWIDVFGGPKGYETLRSFRRDRVAAVHNTSRMRPGKPTAAGQVAA
jgi:hypothetical protein